MRKRRAVLNLMYASIALSILEAEGLAAVCCTAVEAKWRGYHNNQKVGSKSPHHFSLSLVTDGHRIPDELLVRWENGQSPLGVGHLAHC